MKRILLTLVFLATAAHAASFLSDAEKTTLEKRVNTSFDRRPVSADSIEYALLRASQGDQLCKERVRKALGHRKPTPGQDLRLFSLAYRFLQTAKDLETAQRLAQRKARSIQEIVGLTTFYEITGEVAALEKAITTAKKLPLSAGSAFLSLYAVTGDRHWLKKARQSNEDSPRFLNLLFHYTGDASYRQRADTIRSSSKDAVLALSSIRGAGSILLTDWERTNDPLHITVVGGKTDQTANALFQAALRYPSFYKRVEWWDRTEGPMPNPDVQYPTFPKAAAFACSKKSCSFPIFEPSGLESAVNRLKKK